MPPGPSLPVGFQSWVNGESGRSGSAVVFVDEAAEDRSPDDVRRPVNVCWGARVVVGSVPAAVGSLGVVVPDVLGECRS